MNEYTFEVWYKNIHNNINSNNDWRFSDTVPVICENITIAFAMADEHLKSTYGDDFKCYRTRNWNRI
jgi:hypothetical protein